MTLILSTPARLEHHQVEQVRSLVAAATVRSASPPLSEQTLLSLEAGPPHRHAVLAGVDRQVLAYGHAQPEPDGLVIELVTIDHGQAETGDVGVAEQLVSSLRADTDDAVLLWSHGADSTAERFGRAAGWHPVRELLQMRRELGEAPLAHASGDFHLRAFRPGHDEPAWLKVNAAAFAQHPEQGAWTEADLESRLKLDWFDPAGLLVAEHEGEIVGFHWTKVHSDTHPATGEVYVLGVHPSIQGRRLGVQLLDAGLAHLAAQGIKTVSLYVEADNASAVGLYRKLGFEVFSRDLQFAAPAKRSHR